MKTLCVVEDDELDQRIIKLNLSRINGFGHVLFFKDGERLVNFIKSNITDLVNLPDVIFLDLEMPVMDGWHVLDYLDNVYYRLIKPISVYIISTSVNPIDRNRSMEYHFVREFISKPIYRDKLAAIAVQVNISSLNF
ncbi:response regulator [Mucilaginibacter sp.]